MGKYKVGDQVKYESSDDINRLYEIVADNDIPYKHLAGDIFPNQGKDFVIIPVVRTDFEPFVHVQSRELRDVSEYK